MLMNGSHQEEECACWCCWVAPCVCYRYTPQTQMHCTTDFVKKSVMPCEGLKLTNPRSFWETSLHTLWTMSGYGGCDCQTWWCWRKCQRKAPASTVLQQRTVHNEHFFPTQRCVQVHLVERFIGSTVTYWFLHSFSWLVLVGDERSCQKKGDRRPIRTVDRSPPAGAQLASGKGAGAYANVQDQQQILPNKALVDKDVRKTFADSVSCLFWELPECTVDAEVEWWLFKAAVASSAARICGQKWFGVVNN